MRISGESYRECPISLYQQREVGEYDVMGLLDDAFEAYDIMEMGHLPESGAWFNQTDFFTKASKTVRGEINAHQKKQLEDSKQGK